MKKILVTLFVSVVSQIAWSATGPIFSQGKEVFRVVNERGQTPTYRVLNGSVLKQSLAVAVNTKWKLNEPGSKVQPYVDLKIEKVVLTPVKNKASELALAFQISGREFEVDRPISREQFLAGKPILLKLPQKTEALGMFKVSSQGRLTLRYQNSGQSLSLEDGLAKMEIESPLSDDESESIAIKAKGIRL